MTLKRGDKGDAVRALQTHLVQLGFLRGTGAVDGDYGAKTEAAVRAYQEAASLPPTGIAEEATRASLGAAAEPQTVIKEKGTPPAATPPPVGTPPPPTAPPPPAAAPPPPAAMPGWPVWLGVLAVGAGLSLVVFTLFQPGEVRTRRRAP